MVNGTHNRSEKVGSHEMEGKGVQNLKEKES